MHDVVKYILDGNWLYIDMKWCNLLSMVIVSKCCFGILLFIVRDPVAQQARTYRLKFKIWLVYLDRNENMIIERVLPGVIINSCFFVRILINFGSSYILY